MNLLLDTHSFLWFIMGSSRLSGNARALIEDDAHDKRLSTASLWEMAIKLSLGRLTIAVHLSYGLQVVLTGLSVNHGLALPASQLI
jgi:PIN domain nuclease of toxin-antitoxin system